MTKLAPRRRMIEFTTGKRPLLFTVNRLVDAEEHFGSFDAIEARITDHPSSAVRYLLWIGTGMPDDDLPESAAGDLVAGLTLRWVLDEVSSALQEAIGRNPNEAGDPTTPVADPATPTPGPTS